MQETKEVVTTADGVGLNVMVYAAEESDSGGQRDIVLLHGWPNGGTVWRALAEALLLADPRFRVIAPDFRGYGDSDKGGAGYTCAGFAENVLAVVQGFGLTTYALGGHSMGGKIAQIVAGQSPAGLQQLVLVTPGALGGGPVPLAVAARRGYWGDREAIRTMLAGWTGHPLSSEEEQALVEGALLVGQEAWNGWLEPMRGEDFSASARGITVPTLVVAGGKDTQRPEMALRGDVVELISGATLTVLPSDGHLPHVEEPSALAMLIVNFLDAALPKGAVDS